MRLSVTAEDIKAGKQASCASCPVALALSRQVGGMPVSVGRHSALILKGGPCPKYWLPVALTAAIDQFDKSGLMDPGEFDLELES